VGCFGPLKTAYRGQVEQLYRGGANTVGKQHFTLLYSRARDTAFTVRNIKSGWSKAGLVPFNPDRALWEIQKPQTGFPGEPVAQTANTTIPCPPLDEPLPTPITSEKLRSLCVKIEEDCHKLEAPSHHQLQKLAHAAERAFADRALLLDENMLLF
jgi:hypothetical protein